MMRETGGHSRRGAALGRDWTKGNIVGNLLSLSWPMMIGSSLNLLGPTIDMIWVGKLGASAIAGVGVGGIIVNVVNSLKQGIYTSVRAMVARSVGAGDTEGANHATQQAFVIGAAISIFFAVIGIFLSESMLILLGVGADVVAPGAAYMRIQFLATMTMSLRMLTEASMQASGDAVTPMRVAIFFRIVHVILDPFLIFGWWIFPRLGVSGAALANVISQGLGGGLGLWFLLSGRTRLRLTFRNFRFDGKLIWRMVRIGIPASVTGAERSFANVVMVKFVAPFGTLALAAHSILERLGNFIHLPAQGMGQGSGVLAGQNLGAGQPKRAEKTAWLAASLLTGFMLIASVAVWFGAEGAVRVFNTEPGVVKIASTFFRIDIVSYLLFGFAVVLMQTLNGVGDTLIPMAVTLTTMWLMQVPLAYFLPQIATLGVYGVRWAIVSAVVARAALYAAYFKLGRWKQKKV